LTDLNESSPHRPKIELVNRRQLMLRTVDVEQLVPEDDPVRAIWELSGRLDLELFYQAIGSQEGEAGREAIDPRLLICVWVYAYSQGISSAREISRLMDYHPGFQWLTGMRAINHHTLSDFRIRFKDALDDVFTQMLGILSSEGLVTLERVMHDGTKIRANAGGSSFRREERVKEHLRLAKEQVALMEDPRTAQEVTPRLRAARERSAREKQARLEHALEELQKIRQQPRSRLPPEEARVSMTDPDARIMKNSHDGYGASYNVQLSTDAEAGAVVSVEVSQGASDPDSLPQAVEQIQERLDQKPQQMVADAEYTINDIVIKMNQKKVDFIGSLRPPPMSLLNHPRMKRVFGAAGFAYEPATETMRCANGKSLRRVRTGAPKDFYTQDYYRADPADCGPCPYRDLCSPKHPSRTFIRSEPIPVIAQFRARMKTEAAQAIYKQRAPIAEFTNAWIKEKLGLRQFRLRGLAKAGIEALWASLTLNMQLWIRRIWRPRWAITAT
jgi:transposase